MMLHRLQIMRSLATVLTIGIFVFDLLTPAASAVGILYLLPMMIYLWNPNRRLTIVVASLATILTVIGGLGSPSGDRELATTQSGTHGLCPLVRRRTVPQTSRDPGQS